ncbi:hypothetical protein Pcinc_043259 [Petrolisthes cinctipes]|uniref:Cytochrome c biogenesis B n=1 Tax=Petrolisthes cinctipes TaxID=88211 RepID=A0AAE1BH17_PETCI|nr:hypothetical protein Pcinc_043259 [Petrolisthes cinctipes]
MTSPSASRFLLLPHLLASLITEFFISLSSARLPHWCHYLSSTISFLLPLPRLPHHHISLPLPSPDSSYLSHHTTFSPSLLMSPSSASLITHHHFSLAGWLAGWSAGWQAGSKSCPSILSIHPHVQDFNSVHPYL